MSFATFVHFVVREAIFDSENLVETAPVTLFARELGGKKDSNKVTRKCRPYDAGAETQDVHIVVLHRLPRGVAVVTDGRAHAGKLVRGNGHTGPAAAYDEAAVYTPIAQCHRDRLSAVGIINGSRRVAFRDRGRHAPAPAARPQDRASSRSQRGRQQLQYASGSYLSPPAIIRPMRNTAKWLTLSAFMLASIAGGAAAPQNAQQPATQQPAGQQQAGQQPTFRVQVDLVTTDVIARDGQGQFVSDLKTDEFEVYEDGVKQDIVSLVLTHGGRVFNVQSPPPAPVQEGIILPAARPTNDAAGRVFLIFIDDLHLDFRMTPRTRDLMTRMLRNLIHDGDMFGIVSTGTSSISEQLTYDRQVLESSIKRVAGSGLRPEDIIKTAQSCTGPSRAALPRACGILDRVSAHAKSREPAQSP